MKKYKVITPSEEAKILGMTQEEIEAEFEEYETGNWSLPQNARVYTGDEMEFLSKKPSAE